MDILESVGTSGGGGIIGALVGLFLGTKRMERIESDVKTLGDKVVYKDVCNVCSSGTQKKLDYIIERIDEHFDVKK